MEVERTEYGVRTVGGVESGGTSAAIKFSAG